MFIATNLIPLGLDRLSTTALSTLCLMAIWWITEAIPIHITSLVPLVTFPIFGITGKGLVNDVTLSVVPFFKNEIFLFLGGMSIAAAMQKWNLHKRIALVCLYILGTSERGLLLGFLISTMFISLWISNTATAVMMVPIAISVVSEIESRSGKKLPGFALAILLSIAYAANIGGIGTKIGTAPNTQFTGYVKQWYNVDIDFLMFLKIGLPFSIGMIILAFLILSRQIKEKVTVTGRDTIKAQLSQLGKMSLHERLVLGHFIAAVLFWTIGKPFFELIGIKSGHDAFAAMLVALSLTVVGCFDRTCIKLISWNALILLGGSFALAEGIEQSGFMKEMGKLLSPIIRMDQFTATGIIMFITVFASAFTSNTATSAILSQLVHGVLPRNIHLLAGVAIASSVDFMLPAGTPPNAIVFASGRVKVIQMVKVGFILDLFGAILSTFWIYFVVKTFF